MEKVENLTPEQIKELEEIGNLYRETIYDSSIEELTGIVKAFGNGLTKINGDISSSIVGEVFRFHKLISSKYGSQIHQWIKKLYSILSKELPKDVSFYIICRQKSWESVLRKILKYHLRGTSIILYDLIALRIIIDSKRSEKEQEKICHQISDLCINFFTKTQLCILMPPTNLVGNDPTIKDYINFPKSNGYKSIHLAFISKMNNIFEVQIRTQEMDANAEYGPENFTEENNVEDKIDKDITHSRYKDDEYKQIIPYIYFDPRKASRPLFRTYQRVIKNELQTIITDNIGLMYAKSIDPD